MFERGAVWTKRWLKHGMAVRVHAAAKLWKNSSTQVRRAAVIKPVILTADRLKKCSIVRSATSITRMSQTIMVHAVRVKPNKLDLISYSRS
jgi:hypothetical protein